jgi:hypothetical protein
MIGEKSAVLLQVDVEIDLCKDQKVRDMFTNEDAGQDLSVFLRKNNIELHRTEGIPNVTRISLRGSPQGLHRFVDRYLTVDETPAVYNLLYR